MTPPAGTRDPSERFDAVFQHRAEELRALARRVLCDPGEAEDAVQETFLKLAGSSMLTRADSEIAAWLRRVCINDSFNRLRARKRAAQRLQRAEALEARRPGGEDANAPIAAALRRETQEQVREALACLPERQRACLLLRHSGYRYAEIAEALDLAIGSVGVLLARAERAFRTAYEEHRHDDLS